MCGARGGAEDGGAAAEAEARLGGVAGTLLAGGVGGVCFWAAALPFARPAIDFRNPYNYFSWIFLHIFARKVSSS